jgi:hypothetical protein
MAVVTTQQSVAALYTAIFNRAPDQAGLNYWTAQINGGATFASVAAGFAQHEVFTTGIGALSNSAYVTALYTNILGSAGDTAGIAYWTARLAAGESKASVVAAFVSGSLTIDVAALQASGALTAADAAAALVRQQTLTNKADVGIYFANTLGTASNLNAATVVSSKAGLLADPAYQASSAVIANVTNTAASVQTAKDAIAVAAGSTSPIQSLLGNTGGIVFTLVAGADSLQPNSATAATKTTAFNDTIRAGNGTLNSADYIDGGAGTDTLVVSDLGTFAAATTIAPTLVNVEILNVTSSTANGTLDLANSTGYTNVNSVAAAAGAAVTFANVKLAATVGVVDNASGAATTFAFAGATGTADSAKLVLADVASGTVNVGLVENLTVQSTAGSLAAVTSNTATVVDAEVQTLTITGDQALALTVTGAALKTIDASALTKALTLNDTLTTATNVAELTVKATAQADTVSFTNVAASSKVTIDLGAGADTLNIAANAFHKITTGAGADTINLDTSTNSKALVITDSTTLAASVIEITDFTSGSDVLNVAGGGTVATAEKALTGTQLSNIAGSATLLAATQAAAALGTTTGDIVSFQYSGSSYVYVNEGAAHAGLATSDVLIKLTGVTALVAADVAAA